MQGPSSRRGDIGEGRNNEGRTASGRLIRALLGHHGCGWWFHPVCHQTSSGDRWALLEERLLYPPSDFWPTPAHLLLRLLEPITVTKRTGGLDTRESTQTLCALCRVQRSEHAFKEDAGISTLDGTLKRGWGVPTKKKKRKKQKTKRSASLHPRTWERTVSTKINNVEEETIRPIHYEILKFKRNNNIGSTLLPALSFSCQFATCFIKKGDHRGIFFSHFETWCETRKLG